MFAIRVNTCSTQAFSVNICTKGINFLARVTIGDLIKEKHSCEVADKILAMAMKKGHFTKCLL